MAETTGRAPDQPTPRATPAYQLAPVFTKKEKPVCPPFEPGDRRWVEDWYWDFDNPDEEENDGVDRLSALPVEVLIMIISHLTPGSLLAISRTSRLFRSLTSPIRDETIWREARRRNGWRDLEAGGMNEVQHAKLVEGRICFAWETCRRDFSLRTVLCRPCALRLIKEGDAISTEFWHLHPQTFSCCLSTRKKPDGSDVPDGQDSLFYTPDVTKQAALLYDKEANALARNESPQSASLAHVSRRTKFKGRVRRDAAKMVANEKSLAQARGVEAERRRRMRRETITEKMVSLGWEEEDFCCDCGNLACAASWCLQCFEDDFDDDIDDWESSSDERGELSELAALLPEDEELRDARIVAKIKAKFHTDCTPAPFEYAENFLYDDRRLGYEEWEACKDPLIEYAARNEHERLWREEQEGQKYRQDELKPLFERLKGVVASARQGVFLSLATFYDLSSVKTLWQDEDAYDDPEAWVSAEPTILRDLFDHIHRGKVRLFDRIARAHLNDGIALPSFVKTVLECEHGACVDGEPSKGLAPLHAVLTDSDMDPILSRLTSLFRCGICSAKRSYPAIAIHLVDEHSVTNVPAYANIPSEAFRQVTKGLLDDFGLSHDISFAAFEKAHGDARFDVTTRTSSGETETSVGETWAHVLSGKSPAELEAGRRKLSASTDRNILKIRLSVVHSEQAADSSPI
uniref:BY PROTMAP: gi/472585492/gb/EMS23046.1/ F-box domain containing protein [Rhodosporidium toruloides NP11] gi/647399394/emb/CDR44132.1/ RHTO0S09e00298g1_1 [Rhodosporidium toruloides] n=1 Tax=Rhodotorula toruloides TaxID=5286 RepID=A0A0K3CNC6_RHOTO